MKSTAWQADVGFFHDLEKLFLPLTARRGMFAGLEKQVGVAEKKFHIELCPTPLWSVARGTRTSDQDYVF